MDGFFTGWIISFRCQLSFHGFGYIGFFKRGYWFGFTGIIGLRLDLDVKFAGFGFEQDFQDLEQLIFQKDRIMIFLRIWTIFINNLSMNC